MPALRVEILENCQLDVYVMALEADGNMASLAAGITCASIAIADAGIEMYDLVSCCSAGITEKTISLDLTEQEQEKADAQVVVALMSNLNEITFVNQISSMTMEQSIKVIKP